MEGSSAAVPSNSNVPHAVHFESNEDFQKRKEGDSFLRFQRRNWIHPKGDTRANREVITTLLSSQGNNSDDCIEKLLAEEITYRDLGSLTKEDLELMGFKQHKEREELLSFFEQLPNQDPTYDNICKMPEASGYNRQICNSATAHLETMRSALAAANYKLNIMPPEDVIVGEKSFASRFMLEALSELKGVTAEIDKELDELEELVDGGARLKKPPSKKSKHVKANSQLSASSWIVLSSLATGVLAAIWFWKFNKFAK